MVIAKQVEAARRNIRKAQATWRKMSPRQRALAQPQGRARKRPGAGSGRFYRIEVHPKSDFVTFRTQDVGEQDHLERIVGRRASGSWDTVTWLVSKEDAHINQNKHLVIDDPNIKTVLKQIREPITHKEGDVFTARPRKNIHKAQATRHRK